MFPKSHKKEGPGNGRFRRAAPPDARSLPQGFPTPETGDEPDARNPNRGSTARRRQGGAAGTDILLRGPRFPPCKPIDISLKNMLSHVNGNTLPTRTFRTA